MKKLGLFLLLLLLFVGNCSYASFWDNTPVQIAQDETVCCEKFASKPVRVGIGTNGFATYEWSDANIYATGEYELYNNKTYIGTFDGNDGIYVSMVGNIFVLKDSDGEVIEKVSGPVIIKTDFGFVGIRDLKRAGRDAVYRGQLELISNKKGKFYIVNQLEVEDYLKGVVPNEMPVSFGLEALKAQAVAARNYVLSPRVKANPNYDVVDSVASQVYFGADTEKELSNRAVDETFGIVALYDGDLILAQYSSTAGGYTESFANAFSDPFTKKFPSDEKPYLVAQPDYGDIEPLYDNDAALEFYKKKHKSYDVKSPYFRWEREWNGQEIQDAVQANISAQSATGFITPAVKKGEMIGIIEELRVKKRGASGKIIELEIVTDDLTYTVQKELVIRRLLTKDGKALPSANVAFEHEYDENGYLIYIKAYGGGFGHGVGMSQYGAGYMGSELHKSFDEILKHYYTGIVLATEPDILSAEHRASVRNFYTKNGKAKLVIDNKSKCKNIELTVNGNKYKMELDTSERLNVVDISPMLKKGMNNVEFYFSESRGLVKYYIEICTK